MNPEARDKIRSLLAEATEMAPRTGGRVEATESEEVVEIAGDEVGLLRFGLALASDSIETVTDVLEAGNGDVIAVKRVDAWDQAPPPSDRRRELRDAVNLFACGAVIFVLVMVAGAGIYQIYSWLGGG